MVQVDYFSTFFDVMAGRTAPLAPAEGETTRRPTAAPASGRSALTGHLTPPPDPIEAVLEALAKQDAATVPMLMKQTDLTAGPIIEAVRQLRSVGLVTISGADVSLTDVGKATAGAG